MRLFLGLLIGSNVIVSAMYLFTELDWDFDAIKTMLGFNVIWSTFFSLAYLSAWLIEPYIK